MKLVSHQDLVAWVRRAFGRPLRSAPEPAQELAEQSVRLAIHLAAHGAADVSPGTSFGSLDVSEQACRAV
jgi:hypothetical protein